MKLTYLRKALPTAKATAFATRAQSLIINIFCCAAAPLDVVGALHEVS